MDCDTSLSTARLHHDDREHGHGFKTMHAARSSLSSAGPPSAHMPGRAGCRAQTGVPNDLEIEVAFPNKQQGRNAVSLIMLPESTTVPFEVRPTSLQATNLMNALRRQGELLR